MISSDKENALQTTKESDTLCLYIITIFHFPFFRTMDKIPPFGQQRRQRKMAVFGQETDYPSETR